MKLFFKAFVFPVSCLLLIACERSTTALPLSIASATASGTSIPKQNTLSTLNAMPTPTAGPIPTQRSTMEPMPGTVFVPPTLIPTIDPTRVPDLLKGAFSIQTLDGMNGHGMRQITGWEYGFGGGYWTGFCAGYYWLDKNHLLVYPATGQVNGPEGHWGGVNVVPQPMVINLETGNVWLPPVNALSSRDCQRVDWSRELEILIVPGMYEDKPAVLIYSFDGTRLAYFPGSLAGTSPSRTKILIDDNLIIDLRTNKTTNLAWSLENYQEPILSDLFWTSDETRIYRCCYFYADLNTGTSHHFERSDFQDINGNRLDPSGLWFYRGQWVREDTYFLVQWSWVDDGDIRYIPMFDPAKKGFYDVREMAGISGDLSCPETDVSPDGKFLWIMCYETDYLVDLSNFETTTYPGHSQVDITWSKDGQFAWLTNLDIGNNKTEILSISDKKLSPLPITPLPESEHWWHPVDNIVVYPAQDRNSLIFLDVTPMSVRELPTTLQLPLNDDDLVWSPNGEKIALVAEDGSIWQADFPALGNLEQLTLAQPLVSDLNWSPDGNSLSFVSGSNIYLVNVGK